MVEEADDGNVYGNRNGNGNTNELSPEETKMKKETETVIDFPVRKLARQLDFTTAGVSVATKTESVSPEPLSVLGFAVYCECFATGMYCNGRNCVNSFNNIENEAARREAVEASLESNPVAFRPKIASSPQDARDGKKEAGEVLVWGKDNKRCHYRKSGCLKKYCECFQTNAFSSEICKCMDCKNFEGIEEMQAILQQGNANNSASIQLPAANAVITGATESSGLASPPFSKRRKCQELFFGSPAKDLSIHRLGSLEKGTLIKATTLSSSSPAPASGVSGASTVGPKFSYRSLLADVIYSQDAEEFCCLLVLLSRESAKLLDQRRIMEKKTGNQTESSVASSDLERLFDEKESVERKAASDECSSRVQQQKNDPYHSSSDGIDVPKVRTMSPETLALSCNEQETTFTTATLRNCLTARGSSISMALPHFEGGMWVDADLEWIILARLRDCLNRMITLGEIKE